MDLERLIALIVKTVVEELVRQDVIRLDHTGVTLSQGQGKTVSSAVSNRSPGRVVSAQMILDAAKAGVTTYEAPAHALITPLAAEVAREKGIEIISADTG
ncbi:MAG: hypothetical protein QF879_15005 [Candidatus Latescibacteria bacterium]|nr:hypothetical protein [Candidatus Latescibacterota bacterium]MDP7236353.1 hypothetical protein [Candidatus Latescibacterota bacterium]